MVRDGQNKKEDDMDNTNQNPTGTEKDPWGHRSQRMVCRTCMWFVSKVPTNPAIPNGGIVGRCRRHAPTMNGYPVVFENDWCGDHKLNENV